MIKAKITGLDQFIKQIDKVSNQLNQQLQEILIDATLLAERIAKQNAPVDQGTLRNSITHYIDNQNLTSIIGSNLIYALPQEKGAIIKPVKAKQLWIPIGKKTKGAVQKAGSVRNFITPYLNQGAVLITSPKDKNVKLLIYKNKVIASFYTTNQTKIKPKHYLEKAQKEAVKYIKTEIKNLFKK